MNAAFRETAEQPGRGFLKPLQTPLRMVRLPSAFESESGVKPPHFKIPVSAYKRFAASSANSLRSPFCISMWAAMGCARNLLTM